MKYLCTKNVSKLTVKLASHLVWLLLAGVACYLIASLSFIYVKEWGYGLLLALCGLICYFISRFLFLKTHKRWTHLNDIKKYMVLDDEEEP